MGFALCLAEKDYGLYELNILFWNFFKCVFLYRGQWGGQQFSTVGHFRGLIANITVFTSESNISSELRRKRTGLNGPFFGLFFRMELVLHFIWKSRLKGAEDEWKSTESHMLFYQQQSQLSYLQKMLKHLMLLSADKLHGDADVLFAQ